MIITVSLYLIIVYFILFAAFTVICTQKTHGVNDRSFSLERIAKLSAQDTSSREGALTLCRQRPSIASIGKQLHLSLDGTCHGLLDI